MKRLLAMVLVTGVAIVAGCGLKSYDDRMSNTLTRKIEEQGMNDNLEPPAKSRFEEYNVFLRVPKRLSESDLIWTPTPGLFERTATYSGSPPADKKSDDTFAPTLPPLKLHALVRQKPKKATPKKGEPAPPADPLTANRGDDFIGDVRNLMAADYGPEANGAKKLTEYRAGDTTYKNLTFLATSGDTIRAYFTRDDKAGTEAALIFDVPPPLVNTSMVTKGVKYTLTSFALGAAAQRNYKGDTPSAPAESGKAPGGPAF